MSAENLVILIFVALTGLCFGSFFNVVILRGLSGESIVYPNSKCPVCNKPLKWWHNIPVLSYLLLRGKCGFCKTKISLQYPLVELATMILYIVTYLHWGVDYKTLFICLFFSMFLIVAVTDLRERVILTRHAYILTAFGFAYSVFANFFPQYSLYAGQNSILMSIAGLVTGVIIMELLARSGYILAKQRAFGEGDSYIAGALGALFGLKYILWILLAGFIIQFVISLPLFLINLVKTGKKHLSIELIIFLGLATALWFYGSLLDQIIYISGVVLIALIALHLIRGILSNINESSKLTYLPYVPALVIAGTIATFIYL